ncbi:hypothetical protein UFOVP252_46 [uncultured Caudovirales phage]|uniref:Uncharacterized protein n=1 Tax=uncultured Caudovirales phage TaxID=2100421 RepID=A0A6J5LFU4_9CAUD|nr:hypothetical protein UFOVP252_46 [uncultured Caudovirales phage]
MNTEDDEFNRIEMESKVRKMAVQHVLDKSQVLIPLPISKENLDKVLQQHPPSQIPLITAEEWAALNKDYE